MRTFKITIEHEGRTLTRDTLIEITPEAIAQLQQLDLDERHTEFLNIAGTVISHDVEDMIGELIGVLPPEVI